MTQLSLKEAKRLSIIKWEAHVKAGGYELDLPEELYDLISDCGFCERWSGRDEHRATKCRYCEFGESAGTCFEFGSLFRNWNRSLKGAQQILDIIKSIPDE